MPGRKIQKPMTKRERQFALDTAAMFRESAKLAGNPTVTDQQAQEFHDLYKTNRTKYMSPRVEKECEKTNG